MRNEEEVVGNQLLEGEGGRERMREEKIGNGGREEKVKKEGKTPAANDGIGDGRESVVDSGGQVRYFVGISTSQPGTK